MGSDFWYDVADEILDAVSSAVSNDNFSNLSGKISDSVNSKTEELDRLYAQRRADAKARAEREGKSDPFENEPQIRMSDLYIYRTPGVISGPLAIIAGLTGVISMSMLTLLLILGAIIEIASFGFAAGDGMALILAILIFGGITAAFSKLLSSGINRFRVNGRFERYKRGIGIKGYVELKELAAYMNLPLNKVKKDIKYMLDHNYFISGHLDKAETTLMTLDSVYKEYLTLERRMRRENIKAKAKQAVYDGSSMLHSALDGVHEAFTSTNNSNSQATNSSQKTETPSSASNYVANSYVNNREEDLSKYPAEIRDLIKEGNDYIKKIHAANDMIPGQEMTEKLNDMEDIVRRIFDHLKENPESADELNKLMKYYLPTTMKLLDAYVSMEGHPTLDDSNIENTRREIENSIDVINKAFEKLFDGLFDDMAMDITSDISLMKMMMTQDGLSENDF